VQLARFHAQRSRSRSRFGRTASGITDAVRSSMPVPSEILEKLAAIANDCTPAAIGWHVSVALVLLAFVLGWSPSQRTMTFFVASLLASVAVAAAVYGNPFNTIMFAGLTVAILVLGWRDARLCTPTATWERWAGLAMVTFAWVYPHFLEGNPARYLYEAPLGLVPCPTLAMAIGLALLFDLGRRAQRLTLAGAGIAYGLYGAFGLGVVLDVALFAGATALAIATLSRRASRDMSGRLAMAR
jgi:hypothetical protein